MTYDRTNTIWLSSPAVAKMARRQERQVGKAAIRNAVAEYEADRRADAEELAEIEDQMWGDGEKDWIESDLDRYHMTDWVEGPYNEELAGYYMASELSDHP